MGSDLKPVDDWTTFDGFDLMANLAGGLMAVGVVLSVASLVAGAVLIGWAWIAKTKPKTLVHPRVITALYAGLALGAVAGLVGWGIDKMPPMTL